VPRETLEQVRQERDAATARADAAERELTQLRSALRMVDVIVKDAIGHPTPQVDF
jgi:hypothetical protein